MQGILSVCIDTMGLQLLIPDLQMHTVIHTSPPTNMILVAGRKPETPEETRMERT